MPQKRYKVEFVIESNIPPEYISNGLMSQLKKHVLNEDELQTVCITPILENSKIKPFVCGRVGCPGSLYRFGEGITPGSSGTYRCDFCFNLSDKELEEKLKNVASNPSQR